MSSTPNLLLSHIAAAQNQKEVTANADFDGLDEALCSNTSVAMSDADYVFATGAGTLGLSNMVFKFTGTLSATRNVTLPPNAKLYVVKNGTTPGGSPVAQQSLTFKAGTGANTVTISDTDYHLLYCDGGNNVYHVGVFLTNVPTLGTGSSGQPVTTNNPGSPVVGPTQPTVIVGYAKFDNYWIPLFQ